MVILACGKEMVLVSHRREGKVCTKQTLTVQKEGTSVIDHWGSRDGATALAGFTIVINFYLELERSIKNKVSKECI